ncbi:diadenylate cyclase CdaA [Ruminococcus gauvreauii]|uniref:Diadenylate cyclase n=1 Tax=Ruminococcus gauvreauii TaxID=438033 RepID=A0ABY5VDS5_9FIRM|nr:diadenylate cyclase CdaA [Ruminococcus gauvreauii]UWP58387.1 diadenylate cyclase CdaA [Ruminococcus gauvreauii]
MEKYIELLKRYWVNLSLPKSIEVIDIIQILLIAVFVYYVMLWVKSTRAYTLLKGLMMVVVFLILAYLLHMDVLIWIFTNLGVVAITALIIIFQPELRRALEQLGEKNMINSLLRFDNTKVEEWKISDTTINELIRAAYDMGEVKTGALIVIENNVILREYEKTGIPLDSVLTSQLLINIFEHNTPLHDGAVIVRHNRVVAATCYLPLSDNLTLNKNLGTRHRAGVGISEVSDALTIIVSEETGNVSYTLGGKIYTGAAPNELREQLYKLQKKNPGDETGRKRWRGRVKNAEKIHK